MKEIGIGFIGSGFARKVQTPAFQTCPGANIVGVASPNNAKDFADEFGIDFYTPDWKALIDHEKVDLVCISTPPKFHFEQVMYALRKGKHVLCEKPFAMNTEEAKEMMLLAKEKNLLALVDHELRCSPAMKYVNKKIKDGDLGKIYFASAVSHISYRRDPLTLHNWWSEREFGGGAWGAIGSHLIDQLRFHVGEISDSKVMLHTAIDNRPDKEGRMRSVTSDDTAEAVVKFETGAIGNIFTSLVSIENSFNLGITGEKGSVKVDINDNVYFAFQGKPYELMNIELTDHQKLMNKRFESSGITANSIFSRAFIHFAEEIIRALQEDKTFIKNAATFDDGYKVQMVLDSGYNQRG